MANETIAYANTHRTPSLRCGNYAYVIDTSALASEHAPNILRMARREARVYTTPDVADEIRYVSRSRYYSRPAHRDIARNGTLLLNVLEQQDHIIAPRVQDPELFPLSRALPKFNAYTRAEPYFVDMYTRCAELIECRRQEGKPLALEDLRDKGRTTRRLRRICQEAEYDGMTRFSQSRQDLETTLMPDYLEKVIRVYAPFRARIIERTPPIEDELTKAFGEQLNALWMRMLGTAIKEEHWIQLTTRRADFEVSKADRNVVQLAYNLLRDGQHVQLLSGDADLLHYLWMRDAISGETHSRRQQ